MNKKQAEKLAEELRKRGADVTVLNEKGLEEKLQDNPEPEDKEEDGE